ncbi:hypothetical protein D1007_10226 [Hordeum vulgare]|nr:hypothetical protein D1007_10226 [Hordeum vulgare]
MHHLNIASYIPFNLSLDSWNYLKWRKLHLFVLCKYWVEDHVLEDVEPPHENSVWRNNDITIIVWIYTTISVDLYNTIESLESTTFLLWQQSEIFFRDNTTGRTIHDGVDLHTTVQGDMTVTQYCHRYQQLTTPMANMGEPVSDHSLTLQLIWGLGHRFHVISTLLRMQQPFPTFLQARSRLLLEEIAVLEREPATRAMALSIGHAGSSASGGGSSSSSDRPPPSGPTDKGKAPVTKGPSSDRQRGGRGRRHPSTSFIRSTGHGSPWKEQHPWMGYFASFGAPLLIVQ